MAFVYPAIAIAAGVLELNHLRRAPNVQRESCLSDEDEFLSTHLSAIVCVSIVYPGSRFSIV